MKHPCSSLSARTSLAAACAVLLGSAAAFAQSGTSTPGSNTSTRQGSSSRDSTYQSGSTGTGTTGSASGTYQSGSTGTAGSTSGSYGTSSDSSRRNQSGSGAYDSTTSGSTHSTHANTTSNDRSMSSGKLGFMDRRFVSKAADEGKAEVDLAKLASERATNPEVRNFAQKLVEDHTKVNAELTSLASQKNVKLDTDDDKDRSHKRLSKKSGADFDQEFVEHMIDAHEKDIKMFEKASKDAKDSDIRSFASKHVDHLREHLRMAEGLRTSTMPTGRDDDSSGRSTSGATSGTSATSGSDTSSTSASGTGSTSGSYGTGTTGSSSTSGTGTSPNSSADQKRGGSR
jgi:putative membrane protein